MVLCGQTYLNRNEDQPVLAFFEVVDLRHFYFENHAASAAVDVQGLGRDEHMFAVKANGFLQEAA